MGTPLLLKDWITSMVERKQDWQTWVLGTAMSVIFLLVTWGYSSINAGLEQNRAMIQELSRTGAMPVRETLAEHGARIGALERGIEKNDQDHARILAELQLLREALMKGR